MGDIPLGQVSGYPADYNPDLLFAVSRDEGRMTIGIATPLPFHGVDLWTAWELSWLDDRGKPVVATAEFRVDAESPNIVESKSLKLYLNSLAMTRYRDANQVREIVADDLSQTAGSPVVVSLRAPGSWLRFSVSTLPGQCMDDIEVDCVATHVDASLLATSPDEVDMTELHTHLFRSNCPVTNQPDVGSVLIRFSGPKIEAASLLQYLVSFRQHKGFHEACVEQIFVDIMQRCAPQKLSVCARFNRRGGLDINPFRSNFEEPAAAERLWRQ